MKKRIRVASIILCVIGFVGLVILSINAIADSMAVDITSGVIVQLLFSSMFISGFLGCCILVNTDS